MADLAGLIAKFEAFIAKLVAPIEPPPRIGPEYVSPRYGDLRIVPLWPDHFRLEEYRPDAGAAAPTPPGWYRLSESYCRLLGVPEACDSLSDMETAMAVAQKYRDAEAAKEREEAERKANWERFARENPPIYLGRALLRAKEGDKP